MQVGASISFHLGYTGIVTVIVDYGGWELISIHPWPTPSHRQWGYSYECVDGSLENIGLGPFLLICGDSTNHWLFRAARKLSTWDPPEGGCWCRFADEELDSKAFVRNWIAKKLRRDG